jgi:hypothetical protein
MPGALIPPGWFTPAELAAVRLSSKSHWDLPIEIGRRTVHFLVSHPTPPTFDGPEDRNGRRNHDEIRLWADYITPGRLLLRRRRAPRRAEAGQRVRHRRPGLVLHPRLCWPPSSSFVREDGRPGMASLSGVGNRRQPR